MTEVRQIAHNTLLQIIGKAITVVLGLIGFGLIARSLGQEGFGFFTTIYAFLAVFGILVDLGLQMTTTKLISDPNENQDSILSNALTIRLLASLLFLGLAPVVVLLFPYPAIIKIGVATAAVGFVFTSLTATLTSLFQKKLVMYQVVVADVIAKIIFILLLLGALKLELGLLGIIGVTVIDTAIAFLILFGFAKKYVRLQFQFDWPIWRKILTQTWPLALTIALNLVYFKGDIVIMSLLRSQAEVGLYGAPYRVLEVLINVVYLFLGLILPLLATAVAVNNWQRLKNIIQATFDFLIMVAVPLIVGGYFLGRPLMTLMAGEQFLISGDIIKILLLATAAIFIAGLFGYVVVALNQQKKMIIFYAINAVISITAYLIFIPRYGYWAAAWITVLSELFILLTAALVVYQTIKFLPRLQLLGKVSGASVIMAVPLFLLASLPLAALLLIGASVYFISLYLLKAFDKKMVLEIVNLKNR